MAIPERSLSVSDAESDAADSAAAESVARTTATLAWATAAFAFSVGGLRWATGDGEAIDAFLSLVVGGGAAYLAIALQRRSDYAYAAGQRIAFAAGLANGALAPLALAACCRHFSAGVWPFGAAASSGLALGIAVALLATATPWAVYRALRTERARVWFGETKAVGA